MLSGLLLIAVHAQSAQWSKQWTTRLDGAIRSVTGWNQNIVILTDSSVTLMNPSTGKTGVRIVFNKGVMSPHIALWKSKLLLRHAVNIFGKPNGLVCYDLKTGAKEWEMPGGDVESAILVEGDSAYLALRADTFSKVDLNIRKPVWTAATTSSLNPTDRLTNHFGVPTRFGDRLVFQNGESVQAWDLASRQRLYEVNSSCYSPPMISPSGIVTYRILEGQHHGSTWCYDFKTGRELWHKQDPAPGSTYARIIKESYFGTAKGVLYRFNLRTGAEEWKLKLAEPDQFNRENFVITQGDSHWLAVAGLFEVTNDGKLLNSIPLKESFGAVWRGSNYILTNDYDAISSYRRRTQPLDPSAEIDRICKDVLAIDDVEATYLTTHPEQAGPALLAALKNELAKAPALKEKSYGDQDRQSRVVSLIYDCVTPGNTSKMLREIQNLSSSFDGWGTIMTGLLKYGQLSSLTKFLDEQIFHGEPNVRVAMTLQAALGADRRELGKLIGDALRAKRVPEKDRARATQVAAVFGEEEFFDKLPPEPSLVTTVPTFAGQAKAAQFKVVSTAVLDGKKYDLVIMDTAGNFDDLWIRRIDDNLRVFTGVSTYGASLAGLTMPDEDEFKQSRKLDAEREKYKNGGWYKDLARLDELQKDADKDGLTDLVEKRFGTKLESADSDADGLRDDVDAWPLNALRVLSEEEQLLSLTFLAAEPRSFVSYYTVGNNALPQLGTTNSRIFPADGDSKPRGLISDLFGFESANREEREKTYSDCIEYNTDRTIAKVSFRMSFHGDTAIFRKVRDRWILVDIKMRWIS